MGYKATEQRPKTTQLVDDDQLNNILGTKMESGQLIRSNDYSDYSELKEDTEVGDLIKPQPFENINGRPEGTYGGVNIYSDNRIVVITPEDSGEDSYVFIFEQGNVTNLNFTSLSGYTNAQIELVGGGGAGHSDGMGGGGGYYTYLEGKNITSAKNYPITVGLGGNKDGANGGESIFGEIADANAEGGQAGQSLSDTAEVKTYKITRAANGGKMYYYGDYNGNGIYQKWNLPSSVYLPLEDTKKTSASLNVGGTTIKLSNLIKGKKCGNKVYYNYSNENGSPYFQIPGDATIIEAVGQRYYGNTSGKRGQGGTLGILKLTKTSISYSGYAGQGGHYGAGGDAMNLGLNGEYLYKREKVKKTDQNPARFYSSKTGDIFTPNDFYYNFYYDTTIEDKTNDDLVGRASGDTGKELELNFVYYKNGSNVSRITRNFVNFTNIKYTSISLSTHYPDSGVYYLCYINFKEENGKQNNIFSSDASIPNGTRIPCWVEGIEPTGTIIENHAHLPAASQRAGGDGVVVLKLTKPK